jgi:hypothetical protein
MEASIEQVYKAILIAVAILLGLILISGSFGIELPLISSFPGLLKPFGA